MERCFICYNNIDNNTIYVPMMEEYIGNPISIFKNTFIIKTIDKFTFAYYCVCNICINDYLKYHGKIFKYLKQREIGKKI
jgi:hypothetical protein